MRTRDVDAAEVLRFRLPISGRWVALRRPNGTEDLLLAEAPRTAAGDAAVAAALASRLASAVDGEPIDWGDLPVTDLDALVLQLRQALIGDRIRADVACPAAGCGRPIDIEFRVSEFLAHHATEAGGPRDVPDVAEPAEEPGWFRLAGDIEHSGLPADEVALGPSSHSGGAATTTTVLFRIPTVDDLLAVAGQPAGDRELARRCVRPADVDPRLLARAEAAMEAIAPTLCSDLHGECPECGTAVTLSFDVRWFCLGELRDRAVFIYQDVDLLARRYHWSEAEILSIPHIRRTAYAELARQGGGF